MTSQETTKDFNNDSPNYASAIQSKNNIIGEQSILIDSLVDASHEECILALSEIVPTSKIRFSSRIANNRICVYLDSKQTVDKIIESKKCIVVNHQIIPIRPYVPRNKRIVFSNVHPLIDDSLLETELKKINVKILSPITSVRNGFSSKILSHIISFRRQVYIDPEDLLKVPSRISIDLDDTTFWIYISSDSSACFDCKQEGHIAKNCPNRSNLNKNNLSLQPGNDQPEIMSIDNSKQFSLNQADFPSLSAPCNSQKPSFHDQYERATTINVPKTKKPLPSSNDSTTTSKEQEKTDNIIDDSASDLDSILSEPSENKQTKNKHSSKKLKSDPTSIVKQESYWKKIEEELAVKENKYPLSSLQVQSPVDLLTLP